jgi:proton glutamate symport protein
MAIAKKKGFQAVMKNPLVVLLSILGGVAIGIWAKPVAEQIAPLGTLFLFFIQMSVYPILIVAIASSLASMIRNREAAGSLGRMILLFLLFLVVVSLAGVAIGELAGPGRDLDQQTMATLGKIVSDPSKSSVLEVNLLADDAAPEAKRNGIWDFLETMIPKNIFASLSLGHALEIVFFAIIFGIALGFIREQSANTLIPLTVALFEAFQKLIAWAMIALPIGLVCLMADQIARVGVDILLAMVKFIVIFYAGGFVLFIISTLIVWARSGIKNPFKVLKALIDPIVIALATRNSFAALPASITALEEKLGFEGTTVNLTLPLGTTLGRFGNIFYFAIASFFVIQIYGVQPDVANYLMITAGSVMAGVATAGSTGLLTLSMISIVLTPMGLPVEAILIIFMAIDTIVDPMRTFLIVYVNIALTSLVAKRVDVRTSTLVEPEAERVEARDAASRAADHVEARLTRSIETSRAPAASPAPSTAQEKRRYRVAMISWDKPPFVKAGRGGPEGLDVDVVSEFARRKGIELEFVRTAKDQDAVLDMIAAGQAELGASRLVRGTGTDSRALISLPYLAVKTAEGRDLISIAVARAEHELARELDDFITAIRLEGFVEARIAKAKGAAS